MEKSLLYEAVKWAFPGLDVRLWEPMTRHTTFRIGGRAEVFVRPASPEETAAVCAFFREKGVKPFLMGRGSNLLFADEDLPGAVIQLAENLSGVERTGERTLYALAGTTLAGLAQTARQAGLAGMEFAGGIPGAMGGGVTMNAGAYGGEMAGVLTSVTYLDEGGEEHTLPAAECALSYRHSLFSDHPRWLITGAKLSLEVGEREAIEAHMADLAARRREKQPLDLPSAGSTFKRPAPVDGTPVYAAALIDQCGCKGLQVGGAKVSEKHAGFVVNAGGATCKDVLELMEEVKKRVLEATGILLEPEVKVLK